MKDKKPMSDQSTLWGSALEYWDSWGVWLMVAGGVLAFFALAASLSSSFILWKVAGVAQSELQLKTKKLDKEITDQKAANLALETIIAPRRLTPEQQKSIADELKQFAGKKVSVVTYALDSEGAVLASQIIASVRSSGILVNDRTAAVMPIGGFDAGIVITGLDTALTNAIAQALQNVGKLYVSAPIAAPVNPAGDGIALDAQILVGVKPPIMK